MNEGYKEVSMVSKGNVKQTERIYIQLGNKIQEVRNQKKFSREELAKKTEMSAGYIGFLERGQRGGSREMLFQLEELLELEPNTLISLRENDLKSKKPGENHLTNKESSKNNVKDKKFMESPQEKKGEPFKNQYPDFINDLAEKLSSFDEEFAKHKVSVFMKELQDEYLNQFNSYELQDVEHHLQAIIEEWVNNRNNPNFQTVEGCIVENDQKHYFSIQPNEFGLKLTLLQNNRQFHRIFEESLGPCSVSYVTDSHLPHLEKGEQTSCSLWFHPSLSLDEMWTSLKNYEININSMEILEPRLQWYSNVQSY